MNVKAGAAPSKWLNRLSRYVDKVPIGNHQTAGNSNNIIYSLFLIVNNKKETPTVYT